VETGFVYMTACFVLANIEDILFSFKAQKPAIFRWRKVVEEIFFFLLNLFYSLVYAITFIKAIFSFRSFAFWKL